MEIELNKIKIIVHQIPLEIFERFTQYKKNQKESGGVILGKIINDQVHILRLSIPNSLDKSSRTNFERNKVAAQIIIDYEFINSNGQMIYLGEWHTHPENYPTPSPQDRKMLKEQFINNQLNVPYLLLIIKGIFGTHVGMIDKDGYHEYNMR